MADLSEPKSAIKIKIETDPEFAKNWKKKSREAALGMENRHSFTKEERSKGGKKSIGRDILQYHKKEKEILIRLQTKNNRIFPNYIIDGFEFIDGTLNIIEIKINSGKLSTPQKEFKNLLENSNQVKFKIVHDIL